MSRIFERVLTEGIARPQQLVGVAEGRISRGEVTMKTKRFRSSVNLLIAIATVVAAPTTAVAQTAGTDPLDYSGPAWSPYWVGALIGILSWLTFYFSHKPLGASTAYAHLAGLIGKAVAPGKTESLEYYHKTPPQIEWSVMLLLGIAVGAFAAAWTGGELTGYWLPPMWEAQFGSSIPLRLLAGFLGGAFMAFGARLAGGCTSGHGISGALQLSVGSWISLVCFFLGGVPAAMLLFRW